jgi:hypothetical protein
VRSSGCVGENKEGQNNILLAEKVVQLDAAPVLVGQLKVRGAVSDLKRHGAEAGGGQEQCLPPVMVGING